MKRAIVLSITGLTVSTALSYGGTIPFDTYLANNDDGIITTYSYGPLKGQGIGNTFTGVLLYSVTPITESADPYYPLDPGWSVGSIGTFATPSSIPNGYIIAPNFDYSGTETTLYFEVAAFNGPSWDLSYWRGHSAPFTATLVTGTSLPTADQLDNLQPFQVFELIPEPTTLTLGGLGLAALILAVRAHSRRLAVGEC